MKPPRRDEQNMNDPEDTPVTPFPIRWLTGALMLAVGLLLAMGWSAYDSYRNFVTVQLHDVRLTELRGTIVHLDEVLTMSARMAATTGDLQWERRYRQFETPLDDAVKETLRLTTQPASAEAAKQTDEANLKLVEMENQAFALVRAGQAVEAKKILFSDAYEAQKRIYAAGMATLIQDIKARLAASQYDLWRRTVFFGAAALLAVGLLVFTWLKVLDRLQQWRAALARAVAALRSAREDLEKRVEERTREQQQINHTLQAEVVEHTRVEEALHRSETKFRTLYDSTSDAVMLLDEKGFFDCNQATLAMFGCTTREEFCSKHPADMSPPVQPDGTDSMTLANQRIATAMEKGSHHFEWMHQRAGTGETFSADVLLSAIELDGKPVLQAVVRDITERKELEAQMERLRTEHALVLDSIGEGVHWIDADGRIKLENPAAAKMLGYEVSELIGQPAHATMHHTRTDGTAYPQSACPIYATLRDGVVRRVTDEVFWRKDGTSFAVEYLCTPVRDRNGRSGGTVVMFTDITERKRLEAQLAETHQQLLAASRQAGMAEVATSVLHNVGNVLNSVGVSATIVSNQVRHTKAGNIAKLAALFDQHKADLAGFLANDSRGQTIPAYLGSLAESLAAEQTTLIAELAYLRKNIEHIKDIVAMQQAYAQISGGTETISIPDLIEEALHIDADALAQHNVATIRDYQARPVIAIDKHKVLQILINLVRNAKLACVDSGRTDKQITVRTTSDDRSVKIAISDNGVGIPAENLTRIFSHGFTTRETGHGFALHGGALAAKELGGALTVHSDGPGLGATFTLELPCDAGKTHS